MAAALAVGAFCVAPAAAQSALTSGFDHFATGFPLTGAHVRTDCASCHTSARFKGTPRRCVACHNGTTAPGKNNQHPKASNLCEQCHVTTEWRAVRVDHAAIVGGCASCHNGTIAVGKPVNHPVTNAPCETCHKSTVSYAGAVFDHSGISGGCAGCHNGAAASGITTPPHIPTAKIECGGCHASTTTFTAYTMSHTVVSGVPCSACHAGAFVSQGNSGAQAKGPNHVATAAECSSCHTSTTSWAGAAFAHSPSDTNCAGCHNGATATGMKTPPHIPTGAIQCGSCHANTAASFATYSMNHAAVAGVPCGACHNGAYAGQGTSGAQGLTTPPHIPTAKIECASCHSNTASWTGYTMSHAAVSGVPCSSCHNGAYVSQGTSGAQSKGAGHVATTAECSTCHTGTTTWASAAFAHAATDTNCSGCHNGTTATGMKTPPHIPSGAVQCSNCHTNTAASFATYTMSHAAVSGVPCSGCHSGAYVGQGTAGAQAKGANHVATTAECSTCHKSTTTWAGATFVHAATDTNCSSCHNGTTATGMTTPPHIPTGTLQCSNCHTNTAASFVDLHDESCGGGGHAVRHVPQRLVRQPRARRARRGSTTPPHIPTGTLECSNCHTSTTSWTGYKMNHAAVSGVPCSACHNGALCQPRYAARRARARATSPPRRNARPATRARRHGTARRSPTRRPTPTAPSCHNGTTATGMTTPPHIPTATLQCSNCHTNTAASFTTYTMNHAAVSASRCDSCHNGSYTSQGTTGAQGTASFPATCRPAAAIARACHTEHDQLRRRRVHPRGDRHQLLELPQRHDRDRHDDAAAHPDRRRSSAATATPTRRRASPPTR